MKMSDILKELGEIRFVTVVCGPTRISSAAVACLDCMEAFGIDDPVGGIMPPPPDTYAHVDYWFDWSEAFSLARVFEWALKHRVNHHKGDPEATPEGDSIQPSV